MTRRRTVEAAGGIVADGTGRIAIVHRPRYDDWTLPKGHLEHDETHEDAALREVDEETGLRCRIIGAAGSTKYIDDKDRPKHVRYFSMTVVGGHFRENDEVDELRWIGRDDLDELSYSDDIELVRTAWDRGVIADGQRDE